MDTIKFLKTPLGEKIAAIGFGNFCYAGLILRSDDVPPLKDIVDFFTRFFSRRDKDLYK